MFGLVRSDIFKATLAQAEINLPIITEIGKQWTRGGVFCLLYYNSTACWLGTSFTWWLIYCTCSNGFILPRYPKLIKRGNLDNYLTLYRSEKGN